MTKTFMLLTALLAAGGLAAAETVTIECIGTVEFNQVNQGVLADVTPGDAVVATFTVDSDTWLDSPSGFGVRSYPIDMSSFQLTIGAVGPVALVDPQPYERTPYFNLRNDDPAVDGFFVACNQEYDTWFPAVEIPGQIDTWFGFHWYASYTGDTFGNLDILDALGSYGYTGLTSFYTVLADGWADAIGFELVQTNISAGSVATEAATMSAIKAIYR